jgi:hypothetical protein
MIGVISGKSKTNKAGKCKGGSLRLEVLQSSRVRRKRNAEVLHSGALYSPEVHLSCLEKIEFRGVATQRFAGDKEAAGAGVRDVTASPTRISFQS